MSPPPTPHHAAAAGAACGAIGPAHCDQESQMPETIVITGTATAMGRATVGKFAAEGWNVVATVRKAIGSRGPRRPASA
jgi:predicted GTPase